MRKTQTGLDYRCGWTGISRLMDTELPYAAVRQAFEEAFLAGLICSPPL